MINNFNKIFEPVLTGKENLNKTEIQVKCCFHDDSKPSLCINTETGLYHCKGCGEKGSSIGFYIKTRGVTYTQALKELGKYDENYFSTPVKTINKPQKSIHIDTDYTDYIIKKSEDTLLNDKYYQFFGRKLFELRGITYNTAITCGISYDPQKGWIFPVYKYPSGKCVGYEVRKKDFTMFSGGNKCYKAINTPACLSITYSPVGYPKKCYICEGFIDSYFLFQYLSEKKDLDCVILTPSNGVKTIPELVNDLWDDFDEIIFIIDNDPWKWNEKKQKKESPGNETIEIISKMQHNGKFKFFIGLKEGEDFEKWYKRKNMM